MVLASEVLGAGVPKWKQEVTGTKRCPLEMFSVTEGQKVQAQNSWVKSMRLTSGYQEQGNLARLDAWGLESEKMNAFQL